MIGGGNAIRVGWARTLAESTASMMTVALRATTLSR
jgi:hypothetical protein